MIQVIGHSNGWGLSRDFEVLRQALAPRHEVIFTDWKHPRRGLKCEANIFTELINPVFYQQAPVNYGLLNPEWTVPEFAREVPRLTMVLAKTRDAYDIFSNRGRCAYVGFTSPDMMDASVDRRNAFLHVAGGSMAKGTAQVIEAFRRMRHHHLTIIGDRYVPKDLPGNVTCLGRVDEARLRHEMNAHRIHLCPSSYEGFGHYINEARSVGATIIITNAAPMNELCTSEFAFGASWDRAYPQHLAMHKVVNVESLIECCEMAYSAEPLGEKAREAYLREGQEFHERMKTLLP